MQLTDLMWALAELRQDPGAQLLDRFTVEAGRGLPLLSAGELCTVVHVLVRFGRQPPRSWLALLASEAAMQLAELAPSSLAAAVSVFGRARYHPGAAWVEGALARVQGPAPRKSGGVRARRGNSGGGGSYADAMSATDWARLLQGLWSLGAQPDQAWLDFAAAEVAGKLRGGGSVSGAPGPGGGSAPGGCTGSELLACMQALASLGYDGGAGGGAGGAGDARRGDVVAALVRHASQPRRPAGS